MTTTYAPSDSLAGKALSAKELQYLDTPNRYTIHLTNGRKVYHLGWIVPAERSHMKFLFIESKLPKMNADRRENLYVLTEAAYPLNRIQRITLKNGRPLE